MTCGLTSGDMWFSCRDLRSLDRDLWFSSRVMLLSVFSAAVSVIKCPFCIELSNVKRNIHSLVFAVACIQSGVSKCTHM